MTILDGEVITAGDDDRELALGFVLMEIVMVYVEEKEGSLEELISLCQYT